MAMGKKMTEAPNRLNENRRKVNDINVLIMFDTMSDRD
jgi:hypothetical protein